MIRSTRKIILRANALYLGIASVAAFLLLDLRGIVFGAEPVAQVVAVAPYAAMASWKRTVSRSSWRCCSGTPIRSAMPTSLPARS